VFFWDDLSPGIAEAIDAAISELEAGGAQIVSVEMDEAYPTFELFKQGGPVSIELHRFISERLPTWLDKMDPNVAARVGDAGALPKAEYQRRLDVMRDLAQRAHRRLAEVEAILTPTVAVTPPTLTDVEDSEVYRSKNLLSLRNTSIASYLGLCAATVPVGVDAEAMPVGLQIIGKGGDDARVLAIAAAIERRLGTARDRLGTPPQLG
jgi:aspartyl-tRNA(Asn)/glutamyl-tRNA(Gln) amidotransferase subunit A